MTNKQDLLKITNIRVSIAGRGSSTAALFNNFSFLVKSVPCYKTFTMGKFATKTGKDGKHYFNLKANNGQVILSSQGYTTSSAMQDGIDSVKANAADDGKYDRLSSANGKHYFNLKAGNGQVIGKSEMYESSSGMENGIESVKNNAPGASVEAE